MSRQEAERFVSKARHHRVRDWQGSMNLASALGIAARYEEAEFWARRALALARNGSTLFNLAFILESMGNFDESFRLAEEAVAFDPTNKFAGLFYAEALLRRGDWDRGWIRFERHCWGNEWLELARYRPEWHGPVSYGTGRGPVPDGTGHGEPIAGKRIFLIPIGGAGDHIFFFRWAGELKRAGATVILGCSAPLEPLFAGHEWADRVVPVSTNKNEETIITFDEFDLFCPLMGLPRRFGARPGNCPWEGPYIKAKRKVELERNGKPLVGLCSQAGELNEPRRVRSMTQSQAQALTAIDSVEWVSLEYGRQPLIHDWADTAALIEALDLVVTVDTGVAHLAGAMGKPTWVVLQGRSGWQYLLHRNDSPIYPSWRLFRNEGPGMDNAVEKVAKELLISDL
jgi:hypothetical protein